MVLPSSSCPRRPLDGFDDIVERNVMLALKLVASRLIDDKPA
jgi:hypothetical protein